MQNPFDLAELSIADSQLPPGSIGAGGISHWLGTDDQGRDVYSAILYGLRISLGVACASTLIAFCLGTAIGLIAAYFGGWQDALLMRLADIQLAFPGLLDRAGAARACSVPGSTRSCSRSWRCNGPTTRAPPAARR